MTKDDDYIKSIKTITEEISYKITETTEEFIFETISPFCINKVQRVISKHDLTQALLQYYRKTESKTNGEMFEETFGFKPCINSEFCIIPEKVCEKIEYNCERCPFHMWWDKEYKPCFELMEGLNE